MASGSISSLVSEDSLGPGEGEVAEAIFLRDTLYAASLVLVAVLDKDNPFPKDEKNFRRILGKRLVLEDSPGFDTEKILAFYKDVVEGTISLFNHLQRDAYKGFYQLLMDALGYKIAFDKACVTDDAEKRRDLEFSAAAIASSTNSYYRYLIEAPLYDSLRRLDFRGFLNQIFEVQTRNSVLHGDATTQDMRLGSTQAFIHLHLLLQSMEQNIPKL